jgi:hypothetical protein
MKVRLIALAALLSGLGAGTIIFARYETGEVITQTSVNQLDDLEVLDRDSMSVAVCNAPKCVVVQNVLSDAGRSDCDPVLIVGPMKLGPKIRAAALDAGDITSTTHIVCVRTPGLRCPAVDGGRAWGLVFDDAGYPAFGMTECAQAQLPCARAPLDGGTDCRMTLSDGGSRYFGVGNVFNASLAVGTQCQFVAAGCSAGVGVRFGVDDPDQDL